MTSSPHIVILGAGLIGLSTADSLLRRGARVTVVEREATVMRGASFANSGMIHPSQACNWAGPANDLAVDAAVQDLALRSMTLLQDRMTGLGLTAMRSRAPGCFQIFDHNADADQGFARLQARGIPVERRAKSSQTFDRPALFFASDRSGDARLFGDALARSVVTQGGEIQLAAQAPKIEMHEDGRATLVVGQDRCTPDGLVVACGAQSATVLRAVDIDLPVSPVRGWAADFRLPEGASVPDVPVMDASSRSALTRFSDRLRLSGTWGEDSVTPLLDRWGHIAPDFMAGLDAPIQVWSGLRPVSVAGRPYIGQTRVSNLWVNTGHGHMGWTLCAGSGALLADMMCDGRADTRFALT
ncbi:D-amino acid dehydrogenase [Algimonas arctica]|uniref:D-amino acid dehydrogenase n=1 Tax=Algimonas arctica TaxID=1479486 RepID=A0A8J3CNR4_9PROT|nr:FAD-dependent oxidoreductase [Algimonas arctica]GHA88915.1 D-amino acid dehydrogenase [Algimonas arctica]